MVARVAGARRSEFQRIVVLKRSVEAVGVSCGDGGF